MNRYQIVLSVKGSHLEDGEENVLELYTEGVLSHEKGRYMIEYDESEIMGTENTKTRLMIDNDSVWLNRSGFAETELLFYKEQSYDMVYETPFGQIPLSVFPMQVLSNMSVEKGDIDLEYVIKIGDQRTVNRLNIQYKTRN